MQVALRFCMHQHLSMERGNLVGTPEWVTAQSRANADARHPPTG